MSGGGGGGGGGGGFCSEPELRRCSAALAAACDASACRDAVGTMLELVENCVEHPSEGKYRRVRLANERFRARVWLVPGCRDYLEASGFAVVPGGAFLELAPECPPALLVASLRTLRTAAFDAHQRYCAEQERNVQAAHADATAREAKRLRLQDRGVVISASTDACAPDAAAAVALSAVPTAVLERLTTVLRNVALHGEDAASAADPAAAKYFTLKRSNDKVAEVLREPAAAALLTACGFAEETAGGAVSVRAKLAADAASCVAGACQGLRTLEEALRLHVSSSAADHSSDLRMLRERGPRVPKEFAPPPAMGEMSQAAKEERLAATSLVGDVQGFMEQDWLLRGAVGYRADFRKEGKLLLAAYAAGEKGLAELHALRDRWEAKVAETKRETGRSMLDTIYTPPDAETGKPHPSTFTGRKVT